MNAPLIDWTLDKARRYHATGRLGKAEKMYRRALEIAPDRADVLHRLGIIALQTARADDAARYLSQAVHLDPGDAPAFSDFGNALISTGRTAEAIDAFREAISRDPRLAAAHCNLGTALRAQGDLAGAEDSYRQAIAIDPRMPQAFSNLASLRLARGDAEEAASLCRSAIALEPGYAEAHTNLAAALLALGDVDDALSAARTATALDPGLAAGQRNLGAALHADNQLDAAEAALRAAIALNPADAEAETSLASVLLDQGRTDDSVAALKRAIAIDPGNPEANLDLGRISLWRGDLPTFWTAYDYRWRARDQICERRPFTQPSWRGESLAGKHLLLWGEQGIGDEIMFAGLIPEIMAVARALTVETDSRLTPLIARSFPDATAVAREDPPDAKTAAPDIDLQTSMIDAARWLRPAFDGFAAFAPFLVPDPERVAACRARYAKLGAGPKVGISWWSRHPKLAGKYSLPLEDLVRAAGIEGAILINLQYGDHRDALAETTRRTGIPVHADPEVDPLRDLEMFAAQVAAMDLVVTIDNSTLTMAAALGKPVLGMLPKVHDWRWFPRAECDAWFPNVRMFRQTTAGDWRDVIRSVGGEISKRVRAT